MARDNRLYPEDQARVDQFLKEGYNDVERKPFKPIRMMILLLCVVSGLSGLSILITRLAGIY
jgi:hypothetical protein